MRKCVTRRCGSVTCMLIMNIGMRSFLKVWSVILISLCALNSVSVEGSNLSSMVETQSRAEASSFDAMPDMLSSQVNISGAAKLEKADDSRQEQQGDCGDLHSAHHQCHVGHCAFTTLSAYELDSFSHPVSLISLSQASFVSVILTDLYKPPCV